MSRGPAGDTDYDAAAPSYSRYRRPEPAIAAVLQAALGGADTVLNVGAGTGSYEPADCDVTAVEPAAAMRAQRPSHLPPAVDAVAERLPFANGQFAASMAVFSVHQWSGLEAGLGEMRRVTRGAVVILSCDPDLVQRFWLNRYAPGVLAAEARRYPTLGRLAAALGGQVEPLPVPIPLHCQDGFNEAYYGRPENLLDEGARLACSSWSFVSANEAAGAVSRLRHDLASGSWDRQLGHLRAEPTFDGSLRLIVAHP